MEERVASEDLSKRSLSVRGEIESAKKRIRDRDGLRNLNFGFEDDDEGSGLDRLGRLDEFDRSEDHGREGGDNSSDREKTTGGEGETGDIDDVHHKEASAESSEEFEPKHREV